MLSNLGLLIPGRGRQRGLGDDATDRGSALVRARDPLACAFIGRVEMGGRRRFYPDVRSAKAARWAFMLPVLGSDGTM